MGLGLTVPRTCADSARRRPTSRRRAPVPRTHDGASLGGTGHRGAWAAIGATKRILEWQADKNQRTIIKINPRNTTQDCSNCGATAKHPLTLDDRTYKCESCGMIMDRDKNSALNMLKRAGFNPRIPENVRRDKAAEPDAQLSHGSRIPRL